MNREEIIKTFKQRCRNLGLAITNQRLAVYYYLANTVTHPSPDDVYDVVRKEFPTLSRMSVYRILDALAQKGIIQKITYAGNKIRYDANAERHCHFACRICGRVYDIPAPEGELDKLPIRIEPPTGFLVEDFFVSLTGVCSQCQQDVDPS